MSERSEPIIGWSGERALRKKNDGAERGAGGRGAGITEMVGARSGVFGAHAPLTCSADDYRQATDGRTGDSIPNCERESRSVLKTGSRGFGVGKWVTRVLY